MKQIALSVALMLSCIVLSQEAPSILSDYEYETNSLLTEDGDVFLTWVVNDKQADVLIKELKSYPLIEVDRSEKFLVFKLHTDGEYEYMISRNKWTNRMYFRRVTIYSVVD